jgi:hypothetical protein
MLLKLHVPLLNPMILKCSFLERSAGSVNDLRGSDAERGIAALLPCTVLDIPQDVMLAFKHENTITTPLRTKQIIRVGCRHHEYSNEPLGRVGVHAGLTRQEMALPHHTLTAGFFQSKR